MSPSSTNRFSKDESSNIASPPPSLLRRRTGNAETFGPSLDERDLDSGHASVDTTSPFGSLKRTSTQPASAGLNGPSSPWATGPQSAGFAPMGAFGKFGSADAPSSDRRPGFGSVRGQSRFKGLMGTGSAEDNPKSRTGLDSLSESTSNQQNARWGPSRPTQGSKNLYEDEEDIPAGSAALGGDDASPPVPQSSRFRSLDQHNSFDDTGFSSLGLGGDQFPQRREFSNHHQQTPQRNSGLGQAHDSMSPTSTNPYQSPEGDRALPVDNGPDDDIHHGQYTVNAGFGPGGRSLQNQFESHDRSQTSSAKGFPNLGGLGNLSNLGGGGGSWSAAPGAIGTPSRANAPPSAGFGDAFGPFGDLNSAGLNNSGFFGSGPPPNSSVGAVGGGRSKLGALFPSAMQDQMHGDPSRQDVAFGDGDAFSSNAPGFGSNPRESDNSRSMSKMDDMLAVESRTQLGHSAVFDQDLSQPQASAPLHASYPSGASSSQYFPQASEPDTASASNQLPPSQKREMVMPDRMRWIYRDPSGKTQGPWSGLEMHDWYKAGFFSPELQVKKLEESDYEPLAQLIRRIGNSREPFLVPQIGIPHGSSGPPPNATATATATTPSAGQSSSAQPPFASSFPSFGTTLTAEQQNALERRKQEEQYLMARQKEHLAAQQAHMKQQLLQGGGIHAQQLHHQSSGQSLHSQPSFGSITSPGYQPSPSQVPIQPPSMPGFFDGPPRNAGPPFGADALGPVREEDLPGFMERLQMGRGAQHPYGGSHGLDHQQQVNVMMQDRARQQREQEQFEALQRSEEPRGSVERLEQFQQLRAQDEDKSFQQPGTIGVGRQSLHQQMQDPYQELPQQFEKRAPEQLSLSEQVQKAAEAVAKQRTTQAQQIQSPWKIDTGMPQPLPPPQSSSPMPAPTPQRNRQSVADALNAESQSPSGTDSIETPSAVVAPWAKETSESSKGPSLKEIQDMEAKQAAQHDELQAAARRAVLEQERLNQKSQPVAPAPGLPSSANWASGVSPAVPVPSGASAWAKSSSGKPVAATPASGAKKTLAQIQKEEEARKNRAAAAAAATASATSTNANAPPMAGGKRYADLASKTAPQQPTGNAAWTTVGASGKAKTPTPAASVGTRPANGSILQPSSMSVKSKPAASGAARATSTVQTANDEFHRWAKNALSKGLNAGINSKQSTFLLLLSIHSVLADSLGQVDLTQLIVDGFLTTLFDLPPEPEIISDSVYASSSTIDGRRFAEEFIRRRKLADRGVIPDANTASTFSSNNSNETKNGSGGWSEVAKKGGIPGGGSSTAEKDAPGFKVVSGKKKGGKR